MGRLSATLDGGDDGGRDRLLPPGELHVCVRLATEEPSSQLPSRRVYRMPDVAALRRQLHIRRRPREDTASVSGRQGRAEFRLRGEAADERETPVLYRDR